MRVLHIASAGASLSVHADTPRHLRMPLVCCFGSNSQRCAPVTGSIAIKRRELEHTTRLPSIRLGSSWKASSDLLSLPVSPVWNSQAFCRLFTLLLLICDNCEYFAP